MPTPNFTGLSCDSESKNEMEKLHDASIQVQEAYQLFMKHA